MLGALRRFGRASIVRKRAVGQDLNRACVRCSSLFVVRVNETGPGGSGRCSDLRATLFGVCRRRRGGVCLSDADEDGDEGGFERRVSGGHSIVQVAPIVFRCFGGGISMSRRRVSISVVVVVEMRLCCWSNLAQSVVFPPIPRLTMISAEPSVTGSFATPT